MAYNLGIALQGAILLDPKIQMDLQKRDKTIKHDENPFQVAYSILTWLYAFALSPLKTLKASDFVSLFLHCVFQSALEKPLG